MTTQTQQAEVKGWTPQEETQTNLCGNRVNQALETRRPRMLQEGTIMACDYYGEPTFASTPMDYCSRDVGGANRCQFMPMKSSPVFPPIETFTELTLSTSQKA
jgi:hypothetical protein